MPNLKMRGKEKKNICSTKMIGSGEIKKVVCDKKKRLLVAALFAQQRREWKCGNRRMEPTQRVEKKLRTVALYKVCFFVYNIHKSYPFMYFFII